MADSRGDIEALELVEGVVALEWLAAAAQGERADILGEGLYLGLRHLGLPMRQRQMDDTKETEEKAPESSRF